MGGQVQSTRFLFLGDQDAKLLSNTAVIVKETLGSVILFFSHTAAWSDLAGAGWRENWRECKRVSG